MGWYIRPMAGSSRRPRGLRAGIVVVPGAVRRARLDAGLTLAQLAEPHYTRAALSYVESGQRRPSSTMLVQIAKRTEKPLTHFIDSPGVTPQHRDAIGQLQRLVSTLALAEAIAFGERLLEAELPREVEAEARFLVGRACVRSADGGRAYPHLVRARHLYELLGDQIQLADTLNQLACALLLLDDVRALPVAHEALDACERVSPEQPELMVRTLILLGGLFFRLQDFHRAEQCYNRALQHLGSVPGIRNLAMIHDQLNMTYQRMGRFSEALEHAHKAMKLYRGSVDPTDLFRAEHNLGETLLKQGELQAARPYLERALALCEQPELQRYFHGYALLSMAELHLGFGDLDLAELRLTQALDLAERLSERSHEANAWRLWGRLHSLRGGYEPAAHAFANAARLFKELELPVDVFDVQLEHARALQSQGRTSEACALFDAAGTSAQHAVRRIQGAWADLMAAGGQA